MRSLHARRMPLPPYCGERSRLSGTLLASFQLLLRRCYGCAPANDAEDFIPYLNRVHIPQARLRDIQLKRARMREVDLQEALLSRADLTEASLKTAKPNGAHLRGTRLDRASLKEAELRRLNCKARLSSAPTFKAQTLRAQT
jgi:uncharacterized protein YjbI with pentapeptide repeats